MRIAIDLQGAQSESRWRGIGRYVLAVTQEMALLRGDDEIFIVLNDAFPDTLVSLRDLFEPMLGAENIKVWSAPGPVRGCDSANKMRRSRAEAIREAFLASLNPDIVLITSLFEGHSDDAVTSVKRLNLRIPVAVILYDLIPLHDPDRFLKPVPTWEDLYREKLDALSRADLLLAISEFSAADAARHLGPGSPQIATISAACSELFRPSDMPLGARIALRARLGIDRPYILTSGTIEPHKNLATLFAAFARLRATLRETFAIVLVGRVNDRQKEWLGKMVATAGMDQQVLIVPGYLRDENLVALYSDAELMVFPSMDEGFGLPPLEAMSCGVPTIGANAASIPEVIGLSEAQFDPLDAEGLARLITRSLEDPVFRERLCAHAKERSKAFSWKETARRALIAMRDLVAARRKQHYPASSPVEACLDSLANSGPSKTETAELAQALAFNFSEKGRATQLFVDVSELHRHDARTGCQRVTRSVLQEWLANPPDGFAVTPVYATTNVTGYYCAQDFLAKLTGTPPISLDAPIDYAPGDVFFGLDLNAGVVPAQRNYLQHMRRRGVLTRFLVYDLLPVEMAQHFPHGTRPVFEAWLKTLLLTDGIVGISKATVDAFRKWQREHGFNTEGLFSYDYVHLGADIENSLQTTGLPDDAEEVLRAILRRSAAFLMVGTVEPRKGYAQTLDAFERIWAHDVDVALVIVGKQGWSVDLLAERIRVHVERGKRLFWIEKCSDEYLGKIYKGVSCLIAASEGEGFGLPLIEAARAGLPILARNIDVFREVAGPHASYFDAERPEQLAVAVEAWLDACAQGKTVSSKGLTWQTWAKCAAQLAAIVTQSPRLDRAKFT